MSDYSYSLDQNAARSAETIGRYIRETGKYKGKFTRAELLISEKKGSRGIEFDFCSDDGKECTMQIWTHSGDGKPYSGINMINAIMTCLSLKGIQPKALRVEKYDYDAKKKLPADIRAFPDLMGKPIGLLIQKEISEYNGKERAKMLIYAAFHYESERTASEILDRTATPAALAKLTAGLKDKDSRNKAGGAANSFQSVYDEYAGGYAADLDDVLPF